MQYRVPSFVLFTLITFILSIQPLAANCQPSSSAEFILNVKHCSTIEPEKLFQASEEKYAWIFDLPVKERDAVLNSYRGLVLMGSVLKGDAPIVEGSAKSLMGKQLRVFVSGSQKKCAEIEGRRVSATLHQQCCDGAGVSPCFLNTEYSLKDLKIDQEFLTLTMKQVLQRYQNTSPENKKALLFFQNKNFIPLINLLGPRVIENWEQNLTKGRNKEKPWLQSLKTFKILEKSNEVDLYLLAYAYKELGEFKHSIVILERMRELWNQDRLRGAYELLGKDSLLLLAKSFARNKQDWPAVELLELFRLQPERFAKQLERALVDPDFGWIKATKAFQEFEAKLAPGAK